MKTLLLGFSDIDGKGQSVLLAGPEVDEKDKSATVTKAKQDGTYPKGIVRIELILAQARTIAICTKAYAKATATPENKQSDKKDK